MLRWTMKWQERCKSYEIRQGNLWTKCNCNGAALSTTRPTASGGLFRTHNFEFPCCLAINIGISFAFHVELIGAMKVLAGILTLWDLWRVKEKYLVQAIINISTKQYGSWRICWNSYFQKFVEISLVGGMLVKRCMLT